MEREGGARHKPCRVRALEALGIAGDSDELAFEPIGTVVAGHERHVRVDRDWCRPIIVTGHEYPIRRVDSQVVTVRLPRSKV